MKRSKTLIKEHLNKAFEIALDEVECRASHILRKHTSLSSFVMAMGSATFYDRKGEPLSEKAKMFKSFYNFLYEFNGELKLTGFPLRLDKKLGQIHRSTDW